MDHFPASRASRWKNQVAEGPVYEGSNKGSNTNDNIERGLDPLVAGNTRHEKKQQYAQDDNRALPNGGQQLHNPKKLPKRSGTASYITQGGVRITINKDKKHLNGANLTTTTEENMNLMFYDFNNTTNPTIQEETQRNLLHS